MIRWNGVFQRILLLTAAISTEAIMKPASTKKSFLPSLSSSSIKVLNEKLLLTNDVIMTEFLQQTHNSSISYDSNSIIENRNNSNSPRIVRSLREVELSPTITTTSLATFDPMNQSSLLRQQQQLQNERRLQIGVIIVPPENPLLHPSSIPTALPTTTPSLQPSLTPSSAPSLFPTLSHAPSAEPTTTPSVVPSVQPSLSFMPSKAPTSTPTSSPSSAPTSEPSGNPSSLPTTAPTNEPTVSLYPTVAASFNPSSHPVASPSTKPTKMTPNPTSYPTNATPSPTRSPTTVSEMPSSIPSLSNMPTYIAIDLDASPVQLILQLDGTNNFLLTEQQFSTFNEVVDERLAVYLQSKISIQYPVISFVEIMSDTDLSSQSFHFASAEISFVVNKKIMLKANQVGGRDDLLVLTFEIDLLIKTFFEDEYEMSYLLDRLSDKDPFQHVSKIMSQGNKDDPADDLNNKAGNTFIGKVVGDSGASQWSKWYVSVMLLSASAACAGAIYGMIRSSQLHTVNERNVTNHQGQYNGKASTSKSSPETRANYHTTQYYGHSITPFNMMTMFTKDTLDKMMEDVRTSTRKMFNGSTTSSVSSKSPKRSSLSSLTSSSAFSSASYVSPTGKFARSILRKGTRDSFGNMHQQGDGRDCSGGTLSIAETTDNNIDANDFQLGISLVPNDEFIPTYLPVEHDHSEYELPKKILDNINRGDSYEV